jgi:hypothetical protein
MRKDRSSICAGEAVLATPRIHGRVERFADSTLLITSERYLTGLV